MAQLAVNQVTAKNAYLSTIGKPVRSATPRDSGLQSIGTVSHFSRNETVFSEGDLAGYVYKVVSGGVRLCKVMSDGRRQIADFALPGDFFGFEWLDDYSLTAEALSDVTVICYARTRLDRIEAEQSDVRAELSSTLRQGLWAAQNHLLMLGRQSARERIASFLMQLIQRSKCQGGGTLDMQMNRQDIADYLGLTIETVCRVLTALKRRRVIGIPNRTQIQILNLATLRLLADGEAQPA